MKTFLSFLLTAAFFALCFHLSRCSDSFNARHFNQLASDPESQPEMILRSLEIKPGSVVADLGAGGGYYTLRFSRAVGPSGKVYALDINQSYLDFIKTSMERQGIKNVRLILAGERESGLPAGSTDLVFLRNVFHDMSDQADYFRRLKTALRKGGRIAIIDYTPGGLVRRLHGHYSREEDIVDIMAKAGYIRYKRHTFLKDQSFNIFIPAER